MLRAVLVALALTISSSAHAVDLHVIAGGGVTGPIEALAPQFESATGHRLVIRFAATPGLVKMATSEEPLDVAVVPRELFQDDAAKSRFVPETIGEFARVGFGVAVAAGAPKPDIATPEAFKKALLDAKSIATIPASAAGAVILKTFDALGIADEMKAKIKTQPTPGDIPRALAKGEAEMGLFLINVLDVPGAAVVGPFPAALQQDFAYRSAIATRTHNAIAAKAFAEFLKSPAAAAVIKAQGMTPGAI